MDYSNIRKIVNWTGKPQPGWLPLAGVEVVDGGAVVRCVQGQNPDPETTYIIDPWLGVTPKLPPQEDGTVHLLGHDEAQFISLVEPRLDLFYA